MGDAFTSQGTASEPSACDPARTMPRPARFDAPGVLHQVRGHGIESRRLVPDDTDRADVSGRLAALGKAIGLTVYAWALLPSHAHLRVRTGGRPLGRMRCEARPSLGTRRGGRATGQGIPGTVGTGELKEYNSGATREVRRVGHPPGTRRLERVRDRGAGGGIGAEWSPQTDRGTRRDHATDGEDGNTEGDALRPQRVSRVGHDRC